MSARTSVWTDGFDFTEPFVRTDPATSTWLLDELNRELSAGHPLHGRTWVVVARAIDQDDIIVHDQSTVALVHLTWSRKPERLPWPETTIIATARSFRDLPAYR